MPSGMSANSLFLPLSTPRPPSPYIINIIVIITIIVIIVILFLLLLLLLLLLLPISIYPSLPFTFPLYAHTPTLPWALQSPGLADHVPADDPQADV